MINKIQEELKNIKADNTPTLSTEECLQLIENNKDPYSLFELIKVDND